MTSIFIVKSLFILSLWWAFVLTDSISPNDDEQRLMQKLFSGYDKTVRPVALFNESVQLKIDMALRQIIDIDERNQVLHSNVWIRQYWKNHFLMWNQSEFGGISRINIDPSLMWLPDTVLYNNVEISRGANFDKMLETRVTVNFDGEIQWLSPAILSSTCDIDVTYFPFDEQFCRLIVASWTYHGWELNILNYSSMGDTRSYLKNSEWHLVQMTVERTEIMYSCCVEPYPTLTFTINVKRRPLYYLTNLIIPCAIIVLTALLSFYAPPESGERIGLVITTLLAMTVFMLLVAEAMPATSEVIPLVAKFYIVAMIDIAFNLGATCMCVKSFYTDPAHCKMPAAVRIILVNWLAPLLGLHTSTSSHSFGKVQDYDNDVEGFEGDKFSSEAMLIKSVPYTPKIQAQNLFMEKHESVLRRLLGEVKVITHKFRAEKKMDYAIREWKIVARVLDVVFFIVFLLILIVSSVIIFTEAPYFKI